MVRAAIVLFFYWTAAASFGLNDHPADRLWMPAWRLTFAVSVLSPALLLIVELLQPSQPRERKAFVVPKPNR